jgi:hypothetical protein
MEDKCWMPPLQSGHLPPANHKPSRFTEEEVASVEDIAPFSSPSNDKVVRRQGVASNRTTNNNTNNNNKKNNKKKICPSCRLDTPRQATSELCAMNPQNVQKCKQEGE